MTTLLAAKFISGSSGRAHFPAGPASCLATASEPTLPHPSLLLYASRGYIFGWPCCVFRCSCQVNLIIKLKFNSFADRPRLPAHPRLPGGTSIVRTKLLRDKPCPPNWRLSPASSCSLIPYLVNVFCSFLIIFSSYLTFFSSIHFWMPCGNTRFLRVSLAPCEILEPILIMRRDAL